MRAIKWLIGVFAALVIAVGVLLTAGVIAAAVYAMIRMHR